MNFKGKINGRRVDLDAELEKGFNAYFIQKHKENGGAINGNPKRKGA